MLYIPDIVPEPDPTDGLISRACMARYLLGLRAEDFSETCHFVSWTQELPFDFWDAAHGKEVEGAFGLVRLSAEESKLILELASVADGWWVDSPNYSDPSLSFAPLEDWQARVHARSQRLS